MPKIVQIAGLGNVEFPDTMSDDAIGAAIVKQKSTVAPSAQDSPRQKLVRALSGMVPSIPGQSDADRMEATGNAVGMGMGMTMPNPIAILKGMRAPPPAQAVDPVLEQIQRVNAA